MGSFDPYLNWLGIPPHEQPPNFYRLLGIVLFESNWEVIEQAADLQSLRVGGYQAGPQGELCQQLLSEIAMARFCLLDPQQKAAYDQQLHESLSQRGERYVAAPPPPASMGGQYGSASPQYGAPPDMGNLGQPMMQVPPTMMSAPPGFAPAAPHSSAPASMPMATALPTATAVVARPLTAAPAAPPATPPVAPQRPIDELESLASQPTARRRILKKRKEADYSKELIIGGVVVAAGVLLFIIFAAVKNQDPAATGFDKAAQSVKEKPVVSPRAKLDEERKQKEKEIEKEKEREKEKEKQKKAAAARSSDGGEKSPLRPFGDSPRRSPPADDSDHSFSTPHKFGPPSRSMDEPAQGGRVDTAPGPNGHDVSPQDLGSDKDPVFETPKEEKPDR